MSLKSIPPIPPLVLSWDGEGGATATPTRKSTPHKKRERTVPVCATCGRTLSKYDADSHRNRELAARNHHSVPENTKTPIYLRGVPELPPLTGDGMPPTRGPYGDNLVCSQVCGHLLAVRLIAALGPEVLKLLPPPWRHR